MSSVTLACWNTHQISHAHRPEVGDVFWCRKGSESQAADAALLQGVQASDLISYGLIPEFVGRLHVTCVLEVILLPSKSLDVVLSLGLAVPTSLLCTTKAFKKE